MADLLFRRFFSIPFLSHALFIKVSPSFSEPYTPALLGSPYHLNRAGGNRIFLFQYIPTVGINKENTMKTKLFHKDFTLVVIGQIISLFGNAILRFALPLYLLRQTGSAALFGIVTACSFLPMIVLSFLGGILADRVNKRNIMVVLDFSTCAIIALFMLLIGKLSIVPLFIIVLMLLYGISGTYQPAVQASIPALVHPDKILSASALINQVSSLAGLLGPVIGGVLFGAFGIYPILAISVDLLFHERCDGALYPHSKYQSGKGKRRPLHFARGYLPEQTFSHKGKT